MEWHLWSFLRFLDPFTPCLKLVPIYSTKIWFCHTPYRLSLEVIYTWPLIEWPLYKMSITQFPWPIKLSMCTGRWGRVGSGQGNLRISSVAILSQAKRSESTQNHFESFWVGISESHGLQHFWAVPNTMLSVIYLLILNVLYLRCFNFS